MRSLGLTSILAFMLATHPARPAVADAQEIPIGVARVDVSPSGPIRLHGYLARTTESKGVAHSIFAKALAIGSDEAKPVVLISVDNLGVSAAIVDEVAARLATKAGIPRDRIALGASHTHSAPLLTGVAPHIFGKPIADDEQARIDAYTRDFTDKLEQVALDALADRRPATLSWAQGQVGFAANRRTPGGPVDHSLPVLKVTSPDGKIRAILTNYACHCTTIDPAVNLVDGDWAGAAQREIEADHPGCIALTLVGCGADSNPKPRAKPGDAEAHGRALADEVARLIRGPWTPLTGPPATSLVPCELPYDTLPTRDDLEKLIAAGGPPGYNASVQLAKIDRGEALPNTLPYSAQAWKFGDGLLMLFLPGEVVVDYVLRLKKEFDPSRIWVTAYANDAPCYIPSERILKEGGYEAGGAMVYYARPTALKTGVEQIILDATHRAVGQGFKPPAVEARRDEEMPAPLSTSEAIAAFVTKPGMKVELAVAEPLIESPVAIDFGADGRLWVCEMRDYPAGIDGKYTPGGRIKILEDRDHDGHFDAATVFLDDLPFPTGVMCWRKGVIVCAAPQIIYAEDTDNDGKADLRKVLYDGFATENYQARVNGLSYNADGWVYGANGLIGGKIRGRADGRDVEIGGRDFRFQPDLNLFEPASGLTQQGRVHDDWGHQFGGNNSVLIQHYPLPDHKARRNPRVAPPASAASPKGDAEPSRLFPAGRTLARFNDPGNANRVTSACSPLIHRDPLLGVEYDGNAFTCEPVHNLVRRVVLTPQGATFAGRRAPDEADREFLASTDSWFRPVQIRTGSDGALWVVDMYRFVIEHPRWIGPDRLAQLDVRAGADRGRIYRIVPEGRPLRPLANLETMATPELAAAIDTPNGTVRDTVQRLLDHRRDPAAAPPLAKIAQESVYPAARAQALAALDVLGLRNRETLVSALGDGHPGVRAAAVRVAETRLADDAEIGRIVEKLADDPDVGVRYQVALSLGESARREAGIALAAIATRDGNDTWMRAAILSSATPHAATILELLVAKSGPKGPAPGLIEPLIATVVGSGDRGTIKNAMALVASGEERWRLGAIAAILDAAKDDSLATDPAIRRALDSARSIAGDPDAEQADRIAAIRLLGRNESTLAADRESLAARLDPAESVAIQTAALNALARAGDSASTSAIVDQWNRLGPVVRSAVLDALLAREGTADALLTAIEAGQIPASQVGARHRERLIQLDSKPLRDRAEASFAALKIGSRRDVLAAYESAKTTPGDRERGRVVFNRACAACHKLEGMGAEVGPDLAALTDLSADSLLTAILDPNREVDARYVGYNASLKDGRVVSGLIADETAAAITLKRQDGALDTILRVDLDEIVSSGRSLMPEGLENDLKPGDVADVIAYLARGSSRPKIQEGNRPEVAKASPDGVIRLAASAAEIYGPNLVFETEFGNLGYWHAPADFAAWTVDVEHGSMFNVTLEWACDDASSGNAFALSLGKAVFRGVVPATGGWGQFRRTSVTNQVFHKGTHRIEVRPDGPIRGALMDLRAIVLTPAEAAIPRQESAADAAKTLLDPKAPAPERALLIDRFADRSAPLIAALADGLDRADEAEQYRRIPAIWQVAIAAGKRNDPKELRALLDVSLPNDGGKLDDWRAVVIGGGLINGISQSGSLPGPRFDAILTDAPALRSRWGRAIDLAAGMANDAKVHKGTRYDALRMLGVRDWEAHGEQLVRYLAEEVDPELHQGAVCALGDISSTRIVAPILESLDRLTPANRDFAMQALIRDQARREALVDALESGRVRPDALSEEIRKVLVDPTQTRSAERAKRFIP